MSLPPQSRYHMSAFMPFLPTFDNNMATRHLTHRERALCVARDRGIARARDFKAAGIPLVYLKRLTDSGELVRLGRGLYQDAGMWGRVPLTIWRRAPVWCRTA